MLTIIEIIAICIMITIIINANKEKKNKEKQEFIDNKIQMNKASNRRVLKQVGKDYYVDRFGQEAYDSIQNDTDTEFYWKWSEQ